MTLVTTGLLAASLRPGGRDAAPGEGLVRLIVDFFVRVVSIARVSGRLDIASWMNLGPGMNPTRCKMS